MAESFHYLRLILDLYLFKDETIMIKAF